MKIFIKIDTTSIQGADLQRIESATCLRRIEHDVFIFEFSSVAFTHAHRLLSLNPANYLECLSVYLPNTITHFDLTDPNQEISIRYGASDQKRKLSEDLGVGIATLFVNQVLGVDWRTIIQIPQNRKLAATRPDFQGFDGSGLSYFFETKGTTNTSKLERQISKGKDQVKNYPGNAQRKLVIATYFSGETGYFPSTGFVLDPPSVGNGVENSEQAFQLHQRNVLHFLGLQDQAHAYVSLLSVDPNFNGDSIAANGKRYRTALKAFTDKMVGGPPGFERKSIAGRPFYVTEHRIPTPNADFFVRRGVLVELYDVLTTYSLNQDVLSGLKTGADASESIFDDGTYFSITAIKDDDVALIERKVDESQSPHQ